MNSPDGRPATPTWASGSVVERFDAIAELFADRTAVCAGVDTVTYAEFADRADRLAGHLRSSGIGLDELVGICMTRSIDMVVAIFGIWKAGAAFVPLDADHPDARLADVLDDATPTLLLADGTTHDRLRALGADRPITDITSIDVMSASPSSAEAASGSLAYVIFTSGSTGRPKGVQVDHDALANLLSGMQHSLQITSADTLAAITTLSFDISILELVLPLLFGATVAILGADVTGDGAKLAAAFERTEPTIAQATPTTWRMLVDAGWTGTSDLTAICGGERLPRPLANDLVARCGRVFNAYGPTEATIWATLEPVEHGDGPVSIGRPLPNYTALVLDDELRPVPIGDIGQLHLGGPGIAIGYLGRPDETARQFIDHPDHGRLYATGDLVRQSADQKLDFSGRADGQVKIRGFRVELGDIEAHLLGCDGVGGAAVVLREDTPGVEKLVAYVTLDPGSDVSVDDLRRSLTSQLPRYMVPHHIVALAQFPLTPNRKLDRARLPAPEIPVDVMAAPTDELERVLADVWADVLGAPSIGIDDNFFELGGDSLQAARITNRIEEWLGELLWPVIVFDAPTVAQFADYLRGSYPVSVARRTSQTADRADTRPDRVVDDGLVADFASLITPNAAFTGPAVTNPQAIFVLNPPRSGSTLLRVMLEGHPRLFAPPEIELLTFETMSERACVFSGRESYRLEGTIRAVMEIEGCDVDAARAIIAEHELGSTTIPEFYAFLQRRIGNRLLVDKTPANTLDLAALRRVEHTFDNPKYIHLTRHPMGMIRSFVTAHLSEVFFRRTEHGFSPRELAELIWVASHRNTLDALALVPPERKLTVAFEALTKDPRETMQQLCDFLEIGLHPEMLEPWRNREHKMTDGLHAESKMMGDPKFHQHDRIDASVADRWRDEADDIGLGEPARALARRLGYTDIDGEAPPREEFVL